MAHGLLPADCIITMDPLAVLRTRAAAVRQAMLGVLSLEKLVT